MHIYDHSLTKVVSALNNEAVIVTDWYRNYFLLANKHKFQAMFLSPRAKNIDHEGTECLNSLKLLGLVLDNKNNFSDYVKLMCSKVNSKTGVLTRIRKLVQGRPSCVFLNLRFPGLNYYSIVWLFIRASDKGKLERTQEKLRIAIGIS